MLVVTNSEGIRFKDIIEAAADNPSNCEQLRENWSDVNIRVSLVSYSKTDKLMTMISSGLKKGHWT